MNIRRLVHQSDSQPVSQQKERDGHPNHRLYVLQEQEDAHIAKLEKNAGYRAEFREDIQVKERTHT